MGLISRVSSRTYRLLTKSKNLKMVKAVSANSRSAVYAKKVVYKRKRWLTTAEKKAAGKSPTVGKPQRHYPTDEARRRFKSTGAGKEYQATKKLKAGIEKGSVLILVAGKHRGKRVVFLKQLNSGLLLVTGPFKINGVPMRRVNQKYVIATSTKIDFSAAIPDRVNDEHFSRIELNAQEGQKKVDSAIVAACKKTPYMTSYLNSNFCLRNG